MIKRCPVCGSEKFNYFRTTAEEEVISHGYECQGCGLKVAGHSIEQAEERLYQIAPYMAVSEALEMFRISFHYAAGFLQRSWEDE